MAIHTNVHRTYQKIIYGAAAIIEGRHTSLLNRATYTRFLYFLNSFSL